MISLSVAPAFRHPVPLAEPFGRGKKRCNGHGIADTHSYFVIGAGCARRWICSECGASDLWGSGWIFFGSYECPGCSHQVVENVLCPVCSKGKRVMD